MGLKEQIEEDKKALEEALKNEGQVEEKQVEEEPVEEKEEAKEPEEVKEEVKAEEKEEDPDDSGYRKLRRDAAAAKKRAQELEEENARLRQPKVEAEDKPETMALPPELQEVYVAHRYESAKKEFTGMVEAYKSTAPEDFADVAAQYENALFNSFRIKNPRAPISEIKHQTEMHLLLKAAEYQKSGHNPVEELYEEARSLGFKALPKEREPEKEAEEEKKPDLNKLAANKARNAGTAAAKGRGAGGQLTPLAAAELSTAEWAKLPKAEKDRIMESLRMAS